MIHGATTGRPIEILLVEDNPGDVRLTVEGLKESKVRNNLHVARDGVEATQHDDGHLRRVCMYGSERVKTMAVRQGEIEQDDLHIPLRQAFQAS